jgi:hypothetical protein
MRLFLTGLCCALWLGVFVAGARSQVPVGRYPDVEGKVSRIVPAGEAQRKTGVLGTLSVKGKDVQVLLTRDTFLQISKGKLVEDATVRSFVVGDRVSVWYAGRPTKTNPPQVKAKAVLIFRAGEPDLPPG